MSKPLVVIDADVLGRKRTGDESYVANLIRALVPLAKGLRLAAVVRDASLAPDGVEPLVLPNHSPELRMAYSLPHLLGRVRPALGHFLHTVPLYLPCPAIVTVQDLSFERNPGLMKTRDRLAFRFAVPWGVRRAARVIAISERTKRDLIQLYAVPEEKIVVTLLGIDPVFRPGDQPRQPYLLFVGAIQERKDPLTAATAAREVGMQLIVVGPEKDARLSRELSATGAKLLGYVSSEELVHLYQSASCLIFPSLYEGFGLPVLEAMASGTPVVTTPDEAVREVAGEAVVYARPHEMATAIREALNDRERLTAAGLERARQFTWQETARRTLAVYTEMLE